MHLLSKNKKYEVSTVFRIEGTYRITETCVFPKNNRLDSEVVEIYENETLARIGHFKWCEKYNIPFKNTIILK